MEHFPSNSMKSREAQKPPERVERVTSANAVRRRKPLGKQFRETFITGNAKIAGEYMVYNVLMPGIRDIVLDSLHAGLDRVFNGETRGARRSGPLGRVNYTPYNRYGPPTQRDDRPPMPRTLSRGSRARHSFDEIVIQSRPEAEEVLDRLYDLISKYELARVSDLYSLTGFESSHTDYKWGWTELTGSGVSRVRSGGYLLDLPEPEPLG